MTDTKHFGELPALVGTTTKLAGGTDKIGRELDFRERVILVVDATTLRVGLKSTPGGPVLERSLSITDAYELEGEHGLDVIRKLNASRRHAEDEAAGRAVLPGFEHVTDGAGVVETPAERDARLKADEDAAAKAEADDSAAGDALDDLVEARQWAAEHFPAAIVDDLTETTESDYLEALAALDIELPPRRLRQLAAIERTYEEPSDAILARLEELEAAVVSEWSTTPPFVGYDDLKAGEVIGTVRLGEAAEEGNYGDFLEQCITYEEANRNRKGTLSALRLELDEALR